MIKNLLFIGIGGGLGAIFRYLLSTVFQKFSHFFWGTLFVNILGCFLIGFFFILSSKYPNLNLNTRLFLTVGVCGGFTTFSTFSLEFFLLLQNGHIIQAISYVIGSICLGILSIWGGVYLAQNIL